MLEIKNKIEIENSSKMLNLDFHPFPEISTEKLFLKQIKAVDFNDFFRLRSDKNIMKYIPRPLAKDISDVEILVEKIDAGIKNNERINWGIYLNTTGKLIGSIGYVNIYPDNLRAEIGYLLDTAFHGKGLMKEAIVAVINFGFDTMKLHSIEAVVQHMNIASAKLLEKNNFVKEAHFKEYVYHNGKYSDAVVYSLINPREEKKWFTNK